MQIAQQDKTIGEHAEAITVRKDDRSCNKGTLIISAGKESSLKRISSGPRDTRSLCANSGGTVGIFQCCLWR